MARNKQKKRGLAPPPARKPGETLWMLASCVCDGWDGWDGWGWVRLDGFKTHESGESTTIHASFQPNMIDAQEEEEEEEDVMETDGGEAGKRSKAAGAAEGGGATAGRAAAARREEKDNLQFEDPFEGARARLRLMVWSPRLELTVAFQHLHDRSIDCI